MRALKNSLQRAVPAPVCQCECRACDIGIHCSKRPCEYRSQRLTPNVNSRRPVASASIPFRPTPQKTTETLPAYTLPFESVDRKSTRLNSSHVEISYAVFCL